MGVRLEKPWVALDEDGAARLPGQLGVYQLGNSDHEVVYIGYAGGRSQFGLRGELTGHLGEWPYFRVEVTMAYRTRCRELLMAHFSDHGEYPAANTAQETSGLGRLSIPAQVTKGVISVKGA